MIAIALTYHFSRGDSIEKFYFYTSVLHTFATRMDQHENDIYSVTCAECFNFKCVGICIAPDS